MPVNSYRDTKERIVATAMQLIYGFFGKKNNQSLSEFKAEFDQLTDDDKKELAAGIEDGTHNY